MSGATYYCATMSKRCKRVQSVRCIFNLLPIVVGYREALRHDQFTLTYYACSDPDRQTRDSDLGRC